MKKFILLISIIISFHTINAQWQTTYKDSINYRFKSVYFLNNDTGFVGGWNLPMWNQLGIMFRTQDGGINWDTTHLREIIYDIHFINDSIGFAAGDHGGVFTTHDGGDNWVYKGGAPFGGDISSIFFIDSLVGFKFEISGHIYKTENGGFDWILHYVTLGSANFPGNSRFRFPTVNVGYLTQGNGPWSWGFSVPSIAKTVDTANTWFDLVIPANFYPYSSHFFDELSGIAVGKYGEISKTSDGGVNWSGPISLGILSLYDIEFVTDSIGYIVGGSNIYEPPSPYRGIIYKSIDRGNTWHVLDSNIYNGLNKLHFPSDSIGYAVGMNGNILKIINADNPFTSVEQIFGFNNSFSVYPNPATNYITLNINIPQSIIIYDIFGRIKLKKTISNEIIDISSLSQGIYYIKVGEKNTSKFIKN